MVLPMPRASSNLAAATPASIPAVERIAVARPYMPATSALIPYLESVERSGWYSNFGPLNQALEFRLAQRFGDDAHVLTVNNATAGLTAVLRALDLPAGSLCAVPAWTFVATAHAVVQAGLVPYFVDVDQATMMLDIDAVKADIAEAPAAVSAVIPVCAFGQHIDVAAWAAFQADTGCKVVVDAAAAYDSIHACDVPVVVSLHATKALGAGEGGFIVVNDEALRTRIRSITSFGFQGSRESLYLGGNSKMSEYTAAVALAAMDGWAQTRWRYQTVAQKMRILLMDTPQIRFQSGWGLDWVTSVCVADVGQDRAAGLTEALTAMGIETRAWWGQGCHTSRAFANFPKTTLPITDALAQSTLGLPYFAHMEDEAVARVAASLKHALAQAGT